MKKPELRSAVALGSGAAEESARVLASGYGVLAERIIEEAQRHDLYIQQAPELVALLMQLDVDERIPPRLYDAVSALLVWFREVEQPEKRHATKEN